MSRAIETARFLQELLEPMGHITTKRMFGGAGIWCDGLMFALVIDATTYLKVDASNRPAYEAEGMQPFTYQGRGRTVQVGYWRLPDRLLDEPDELLDWARGALAVARTAATGRRSKGRSKSKPAAHKRVNRSS